MSVKALLQKLKESQIDVSLNGDNLDLYFDGNIEESVLQEISTNKREIVSFLKTVSGHNNGHDIISVLGHRDGYVLSSSQKRLWVLCQFEEGNAAYNSRAGFEFGPDLNITCLELALKALIERHEILRSVFREDKSGDVKQFVLSFDALKFNMLYEDLSQSASQAHGIRSSLQADLEAPFDLSKGPLVRVRLIKRGDGGYIFNYVVHHIVSDGWSMDVMMKDLRIFYTSFINGGENLLTPLRIQYKDYAAWQQEQLLNEGFNKHKEFWLNKLHGELPVLLLPGDWPRPPFKTFSGNTVVKVFDSELTKGIKQLCLTCNGTLFMVLLGGIYTLLYKYTRQTDIIIGTPTAGREHADLENQLGCYINSLVLRLQLNGEGNFIDLMKNVRELTLEAFEHRVYPFEQLLEDLSVIRDMSRNALFDVMVILQNTKLTGSGRENGNGDQTTGKRAGAGHYTGGKSIFSRLDLTFDFLEVNQELHLKLDYNTDIYSEGFAERLTDHLEQLFISIIETPSLSLPELNFMSKAEKNRLIAGFNNTDTIFPENKTIYELFEDQVANSPDEIAVIFEEKSISYKTLNEEANKLAHYLRERYDIVADDLIGIQLERSEWMIISILGILKSGGAYLPIDPTWPDERIRYVTNDSKCKLVLDQNELAAFIRGQHKYSGENLVPRSHPESLAYVMYTSGSTGNPKGVMIMHRNVVNFFTGMSNYFGAEAGTMLALTNCTFDISVLELVWTLTRGYKVVLQRDSKDIGSPVKKGNKQLDFSLFYFGNAGEQDNNYKLLIEGAKFADENNYTAVWTPERHFNEFGGLFPNPSLLGAAISTITKNIQIRAGSVVAPLHNPLRIAEEWAVIDNLSGGRVGIACASGWQPDDFVLAPENFGNRREVNYETIKTVKKLWSGQTVEIRNGNGVLKNTGIFPKPLQKELPVWITSSGSLETFVQAGKLGANILTHLLGETVEELAAKIATYRKVYKEHGHPEGKNKVTLMLHTYVGDDQDSIYKKVRKPFGNYLRTSLGLVKDIAKSIGIDINSGNVAEDEMEALLDYSYNRYASSASLIGTKSSCMEMLEKISEIGVDEVACLIDFGVDYDSTMKGLRNLTELKDLYNSGVKRYSIGNQVEKYQVTHIQMTPSMATLINSGITDFSEFNSVKKILLGGERLPVALVKDLYDKLPGVAIYNMYGPTETTIWSACCKVECDTEIIRVGKPVANTLIYILDQDMRLVPAGIPGEICIGGKGVAKGYVNRPGLTKEKFIPNSFLAGTYMYRTGDFGRWTADGNIEFIGRKDEQVKIQGFRIEPGEIETALMTYERIESAAIIAKPDALGQNMLVCYLVSKTELNEASLRDYLGGMLPKHMIPSQFVQLQALPLTSSGKTDKKVLPDITGMAISTGVGFVAPRTKIEEKLINVWEQILNRKGIGIRDDFFRLGGHSLLTIRLLNRVQKEFGVKLSLKELFVNTILEDQAIAVSRAEKAFFRSMIVLNENKEDTRTNVYFIPPVFGSPMIYVPLCDKIKDQFNCYGFRYIGLEAHETYLTSIKAAAIDFAEQILKHQAPDQFIIFAYSMGGFVAFEMAKILEQHFKSFKLFIVDKKVQTQPVVTISEASDAAISDWFGDQLDDLIPSQSIDKELLKQYLLNNRAIENEFCLTERINSSIYAFESTGNKISSKMEEWQQFTNGQFRIGLIEGDHWKAFSGKNIELFASSLKTAISDIQ
jgi:natural product biosynthesis luciferase-like monooxygenase protein